MDMGFAIIGSLARHRRPHIRFLFIGSRLCSSFGVVAGAAQTLGVSSNYGCIWTVA
jgi:hypothetical protein